MKTIIEMKDDVTVKLIKIGQEMEIISSGNINVILESDESQRTSTGTVVIPDVYVKQKSKPPYLVKLTYFRTGGKYYTEGSYSSEKEQLHEIWDEVREMKRLPDLSGRWDGPILIEVPEHPHAHPRMVNQH